MKNKDKISDNKLKGIIENEPSNLGGYKSTRLREATLQKLDAIQIYLDTKSRSQALEYVLAEFIEKHEKEIQGALVKYSEEMVNSVKG